MGFQCAIAATEVNARSTERPSGPADRDDRQFLRLVDKVTARRRSDVARVRDQRDEQSRNSDLIDDLGSRPASRLRKRLSASSSFAGALPSSADDEAVSKDRPSHGTPAESVPDISR